MTTTIVKCTNCGKHFSHSYWYSCPSCFGTGKKNIRPKMKLALVALAALPLAGCVTTSEYAQQKVASIVSTCKEITGEHQGALYTECVLDLTDMELAKIREDGANRRAANAQFSAGLQQIGNAFAPKYQPSLDCTSSNVLNTTYTHCY
jgi:hypothetical protein